MVPDETRTGVARGLYLDLLMRTLTGAVAEDGDVILGGVRTSGSSRHWKRWADRAGRLARCFGFEIAYKKPYDPERRSMGRDWPARSETMIGLERMRNIQFCVESVIRDRIPGDLIEAGVWRGGATIFMRGILEAYGDTSRVVWVADSFAGVPPPAAALYPADDGNGLHRSGGLAVSVDEVRHNFERFGLLDSQVQFLVGWFKDTLRTAPIEKLAVMRLDGDLYESTWQALEALYPKLAPGGFCIVDDYGDAMVGCQQAIHHYRMAHDITEEIVDIDGIGAYWRKRL